MPSKIMSTFFNSKTPVFCVLCRERSEKAVGQTYAAINPLTKTKKSDVIEMVENDLYSK